MSTRRAPSKNGSVADTVAGTPFEGLFGNVLDRRAHARATVVFAALSCLALLPLFFAVLLPTAPAGQYFLLHGELFSIIAFTVVGLTLLIATTWLSLMLPAGWQWVMLLLIAAGLTAYFARHAVRIASVADLDEDHWPLAPILAGMALPFGVAIHPLRPFRTFLIAALIAFGLTLPDDLGIYTMETGGYTPSARGVMSNYDVIQASDATRMAWQQSGMQPTWFVLVTVCTWAGLCVWPILVWLRRRF